MESPTIKSKETDVLELCLGFAVAEDLAEGEDSMPSTESQSPSRIQDSSRSQKTFAQASPVLSTESQVSSAETEKNAAEKKGASAEKLQEKISEESSPSSSSKTTEISKPHFAEATKTENCSKSAILAVKEEEIPEKTAPSLSQGSLCSNSSEVSTLSELSTSRGSSLSGSQELPARLTVSGESGNPVHNDSLSSAKNLVQNRFLPDEFMMSGIDSIITAADFLEKRKASVSNAHSAAYTKRPRPPTVSGTGDTFGIVSGGLLDSEKFGATKKIKTETHGFKPFVKLAPRATGTVGTSLPPQKGAPKPMSHHLIPMSAEGTKLVVVQEMPRILYIADPERSVQRPSTNRVPSTTAVNNATHRPAYGIIGSQSSPVTTTITGAQYQWIPVAAHKEPQAYMADRMYGAPEKAPTILKKGTPKGKFNKDVTLKSSISKETTTTTSNTLGNGKPGKPSSELNINAGKRLVKVETILDEAQKIPAQKPILASTFSGGKKKKKQEPAKEKLRDYGYAIRPLKRSESPEDLEDEDATRSDSNDSSIPREEKVKGGGRRVWDMEISPKGQILASRNGVTVKVPCCVVAQAYEAGRRNKQKEYIESVRGAAAETSKKPRRSNMAMRRGPQATYTVEKVAEIGGMNALPRNIRRHALQSMCEKQIEHLLVDIYPTAGCSARKVLHEACGDLWKLAYFDKYYTIMEQCRRQDEEGSE